MNARVVVASANILRELRRDDARTALDLVLAHEPDFVCLQEWELKRLSILRESGRVRLVPGLRLPGRGAYEWSAGVLGGCVVGARADRFVSLGSRLVPVAWPERAERLDRPLRFEPPRFAVAASYAERETGRTFAVVGFHLSSGVQDADGYRSDRPVLAERHRREVMRLERKVAGLRRSHEVVIAAGDGNFDGLGLHGLTSAWPAYVGDGGSHGVRRIDDVHALAQPTSMELVTTPSDHRAMIATYDLDAVS